MKPSVVGDFLFVVEVAEVATVLSTKPRVGNLFNAVCQFTNNIKIKAISRAKHFYLFDLHSQLPDLNSKRIRDKFV